MPKELINLKNIVMSYGNDDVLKSINLTVKDEEFLTLLGPSGCGKTTTLRIIGGFTTPTSGDVYFDGKRINDLPPYKRNVNTVFQKYALFPHLNIFENIAFGLRLKKTNEPEVKSRVSEMLKLVNLAGFDKRSPESLSGGQQQRVAIARALINRPKVLLLDEPLGALDLKLRKEMQLELKQIQRELGITFIYVTHDQEEALTMSDSVVVMNGGLIQQIGSPEDIYNEPANAFVADFIGASDILDGVMVADCTVDFLGNRFKCVDVNFAPNEKVDVVLRPEDIRIIKPEEGMWNGLVTNVIFKGVHFESHIKCGNRTILVHSTMCEPVGTEVGLSIAPFDIHVMHKSDSVSAQKYKYDKEEATKVEA